MKKQIQTLSKMEIKRPKITNKKDNNNKTKVKSITMINKKLTMENLILKS